MAHPDDEPAASLASAPLEEVTAAVRAVVEPVDPEVVVSLDPARTWCWTGRG